MKKLGTDIAVSIGTTNTRIYLDGSGIVLDESSVVAIDTDTYRIIEVGSKAEKMVGKTSKQFP